LAVTLLFLFQSNELFATDSIARDSKYANGDGGSKLAVNLLLSSRIFDAINDGGASSFNNTNDNNDASGTDSSDSSNDNGGNCNESGASINSDD